MQVTYLKLRLVHSSIESIRVSNNKTFMFNYLLNLKLSAQIQLNVFAFFFIVIVNYPSIYNSENRFVEKIELYIVLKARLTHIFMFIK